MGRELIQTLSNGLTLIHTDGKSKVVGYVAVVIGVGSRDDGNELSGMAHFMEHSIFKGTRKRKSHHILNRLESVGGELDAYTTKEFTCVYAVFMKEHVERAMELLSDIVFNAEFPEAEIKKEKNVVIDEIQSYLDSPAEQIFEDFDELVYRNHPLSKGILGTEKSVKNFKRSDLKNFRDKFYTPSNIVVSTSIQLPENKMVRLTEKYFGSAENKNRFHRKGSEINWNITQKTTKRNTFQSHYMCGIKAYNLHHEKRISMALLTNILGGPAMNSRLNMNIREKHGFTYQIESGYVPYSDNGMFYIYFGSDQKYIGTIEKLMFNELKKLKNKPLSPTQFVKSIKQFKGQISLSSESSTAEILQNGKAYLQFGKLKSIEEIFDEIDAITAKDLQEIANEIFDFKNFSKLIYQNSENGIST